MLVYKSISGHVFDAITNLNIGLRSSLMLKRCLSLVSLVCAYFFVKVGNFSIFIVSHIDLLLSRFSEIISQYLGLTVSLIDENVSVTSVASTFFVKTWLNFVTLIKSDPLFIEYI